MESTLDVLQQRAQELSTGVIHKFGGGREISLSLSLFSLVRLLFLLSLPVSPSLSRVSPSVFDPVLKENFTSNCSPVITGCCFYCEPLLRLSYGPFEPLIASHRSSHWLIPTLAFCPGELRVRGSC